MGTTRRPYNLPQSQPGSDVLINNNSTTVNGITGAPFSNPSGNKLSANGQLALLSPSGAFISWITVESLFSNRTLVSLLLNKLIYNPDGTLVYDLDNTLTLEL